MRTRTKGGPPLHDASAFVTARLRDLDHAIEEAAPRVLADADEEALHDLRVAVRRMRVLLKLARPIFSRFYADAVREPFTAFHRATSDLRDEEVLEALFASLGVSDAHFTRWLARRKRREADLRKMTLARVRSGDLTAARRKLEALLELPVKPERKLELGAFARQAVLDAEQRVEKMRDTPTSDATGLHELRIAYKNLRYAAELLAGGLPPDLRAVAEPAKKLQTKLGDIHDADVALLVIAGARGLPPSARNKVLRAVRKLRAERVDAYVKEIGPTHPHAIKPKPRARKRRPGPVRGTLSRP